MPSFHATRRYVTLKQGRRSGDPEREESADFGLMRIDTSRAMALTPGFDVHVVTAIALAAAFSLALILVPSFQRSRSAGLLSVLAALAYYWREFVGFILVSAAAYMVVRRLSRAKSPERRWRWACIAIFALAVVFTAGRLQQWDRPWVLPGTGPLILFSLGMWPVLKLGTLFWEVGSGSLAAPSISQYVLWVCLPFTLGGPVLRLSQMPGSLIADRRVWLTAGWWLEAGAATAKLLVGSYLGVGHHYLTVHWPQAHLFNNAVSLFLTGPLGFYLTAAGYFHWMEILGRPAGVKIPPSFNYPIGRENISAFWMNWNMTATYVFRDYLFYNRWGRQTYNIYFNTIFLFTLVGLWHAANAYWILWGFLHGLLFVTFLLWRKFSPRLGSMPLRGTPVSKTAARALTYFCVCMAWYLPSKILQRLGAI